MAAVVEDITKGMSDQLNEAEGLLEERDGFLKSLRKEESQTLIQLREAQERIYDLTGKVQSDVAAFVGNLMDKISENTKKSHDNLKKLFQV